MEPASGHVRYLLDGAFYRMAFHGWGDAAAPAVVCVHGLTRNGRDFDVLARALADRFWVVCPDLPGRGQSDWLPDGMMYQAPNYVQALAHLLAMIGRPVAWVGTSLGGICGMAVAACAGAPVERLVLNDIGPHIPAAALQRIRAYMSHDFTFPGVGALEAHLRMVHAPFGALSDADWAHMAKHSSRVIESGELAMHYDPAITHPVRATEPVDVDMWAWWRRIGVPVLGIRGEASDLLLEETFSAMSRPGFEPLVVADAGHAPALTDAPTIARIRAFLSRS